MTEVFKQIIVLLTEEDIPFDVTKKGGLWCIHNKLWDIIDFYGSKIFTFPILCTYSVPVYWSDSDAKSYITRIKDIEKEIQ